MTIPFQSGGMDFQEMDNIRLEKLVKKLKLKKEFESPSIQVEDVLFKKHETRVAFKLN